MAKSPAEQIRDLALEVRALRERDEYHDREIRRLRDQAEEERSGRATLERENAVLRHQFQDHIKQVELWDNRRWTLIILLISTVFSLTSGLIVTFARGR